MKDSTEDATELPRYQVGAKLRELRVVRGLSQRELARRADMTNANLSMIEQGRVSPSIQTLEKILHAIPISLADFFRGETSFEPCVSKRSTQPHVRHGGLESFVCLSPKVSGPSALVIYQHIKPGSALSEIPAAPKDEWLSGVVVQGDITLVLGDCSSALECGDAFQFHQQCRFRLENSTSQEATLILILSPTHKDPDSKV